MISNALCTADATAISKKVNHLAKFGEINDVFPNSASVRSHAAGQDALTKTVLSPLLRSPIDATAIEMDKMLNEIKRSGPIVFS
jgi:hypothetical protein